MSDKDLHLFLISIGLSNKEALLYLALLRYGSRSISFIAKKANFNRGTAYVILHALLEKGLVFKSVKSKVQYFTALEPDKLTQYLKRRKNEVESQISTISSLLPAFAAIVNPLSSKPRMEFFEGAEGARSALEDTLLAKDKVLRAFLSIHDMMQFLGVEYFDNYTDRRIKGGYQLRALRTAEKDRDAAAFSPVALRYKTSVREKREIRHLSDALAFPASIYIFDTKLCIISSREESFALVIDSPEIAQMQRTLFDLIWSTAKR